METAIYINPDAPPEAMVRTVRLAEELGFTRCYVADQGVSRDIYVMLAILAGATRRIYLGPGITNPYLRHPVAVAGAIASLDEFSGGRAFLGLGAGGAGVLGRLGFEERQPLQACREMAEIVRLLWRGEVIDYRGKLFQLSQTQLDAPARPDIELHWGARGPNMLALGGELADVILLSSIPRSTLSAVVENAQAGAQQAGRSIRFQYAISLVHDDTSREIARKRTTYRLAWSPEHLKAKLGLTPEFNQSLHELLAASGPGAAAKLIDDELLNQYVVEAGSDAAITTLRQTLETYQFDGLTIEIPDHAQAERLLPRAAEMIARL
jgi:5,10-methylenetetrahydromethanopterin reductase